jgi:hypothetical protein
VRKGKVVSVVVGVVLGALIVSSLPVVAQEAESFPGPDPEAPLSGYTRTDSTVVLSDESFCRLLLGSIWEDQRLTDVTLLDKTKKQKKARRSAFTPGSDEVTLSSCADVLRAYRTTPPEDDNLVAWARRAPVVPEALAALLPDDFEARPLARPEEVGAAARTSGFGDVVSAPFEMAAETWLAEVDALACDNWSGSLVNARDTSDVTELRGMREHLYGIVPGHYYWDVAASGCDWSVDLVPIELGADPNATPVPKVPAPALAGSGWNQGRANESYLTATQARQALLDAGLIVGQCFEEAREVEGQGQIDGGRVWGQEPIVGTLLEIGSAVDVYATGDCDVIRGERIIPE